MTTYTVSFMREGYICEMTPEEYDKLSDEVKKNALVISITSFEVYEIDSPKLTHIKNNYKSKWDKMFKK